jgi:hypothetical protein
MADHSYISMWVTMDGHIREELLPNGRHDGARGTRMNAYQGRYEISGNKIGAWNDTRFTADGEFIDGVLYHGGMLFYRGDKRNSALDAQPLHSSGACFGPLRRVKDDDRSTECEKSICDRHRTRSRD